MEIPYQVLPERVGPRITSLEQVIYSVVEKKNNLNEKNWKTRIEDRGSRIEDRGSRIEDRGIGDWGSGIEDRAKKLEHKIKK